MLNPELFHESPIWARNLLNDILIGPILAFKALLDNEAKKSKYSDLSLLYEPSRPLYMGTIKKEPVLCYRMLGKYLEPERLEVACTFTGNESGTFIKGISAGLIEVRTQSLLSMYHCPLDLFTESLMMDDILERCYLVLLNSRMIPLMNLLNKVEIDNIESVRKILKEYLFKGTLWNDSELWNERLELAVSLNELRKDLYNEKMTLYTIYRNYCEFLDYIKLRKEDYPFESNFIPTGGKLMYKKVLRNGLIDYAKSEIKRRGIK